MNQTQRKETADLAAYIDASPSPSHACEAVAQRLAKLGFESLEEGTPWPQTPGRYYSVRAAV